MTASEALSPAKTREPLDKRALAIIAVISVLVYVNSLGNPFTTWDDPLYVVDNARVHDFSVAGLMRLWSPRDALHGDFIEYFPLRDSLYAILYALFRLNPLPYHALSVVLHATTSMLVACLGRRLGLPAGAALFAGVLFAVHAVHVESVSWIAGLKDPLLAVFFLLALHHGMNHRERGDLRSMCFALCLCVAGFLVKATMVTFPLALASLELLSANGWLPRRPLRDVVVRVLPFAVVSAAFLGFDTKIAVANDVIASYPGGSAYTGALTSLFSVVVYLSKLALPVALKARYVMAPLLSLWDPRAVLSVVVVGGVLSLAVLRWRRDAFFAFAVAWYLGGLLPVLNIVPKRVEVADRYQYIPSIAACWWVALLFEQVRRRHPRVALPGMITLCAFFAVLTVSRNVVWSDNVTLWEDVLHQEGAENHSFVWNILGTAYNLANRVDDAEAAWRKAAAIPGFEDLPLVNLARLRVREGSLDAASALTAKALAVNPKSAAALATAADIAHLQSDDDEAHALDVAAAAQQPRAGSYAWQAAFFAFSSGRIDDAALDLAVATSGDPTLCEQYFSLRAQRLGAPKELFLVADETCTSSAQPRHYNEPPPER